MKRDNPGNTRPLLATVAMLVAIAALATTPWALSKYRATGTGSAKARIAVYQPQVSQVAGESGAAGHCFRNTATGYPSAWNYPKFYVKNKGETRINVKLVPMYVGDPYTVGDPLHSTVNQVGSYYNSGARAEMPTAGFGVKNAAGTANSYTQLAYTVRSLTVATASRNEKSATSGTDATTNGVTLEPRGQSGDDALLAPFFNVYNTAAGQPGNVSSATTATYDMSGLWRTYRVNYTLVINQVD